MREKQWKIIDEQFISYYGGTGHLISDGECEFWLWHNREESQKVCDMLNELVFENNKLKQFIKELTTNETGRIDLANGYSYKIKAVLTNFDGDVE